MRGNGAGESERIPEGVSWLFVMERGCPNRLAKAEWAAQGLSQLTAPPYHTKRGQLSWSLKTEACRLLNQWRRPRLSQVAAEACHTIERHSRSYVEMALARFLSR
jgi:hypothetical protein